MPISKTERIIISDAGKVKETKIYQEGVDFWGRAYKQEIGSIWEIVEVSSKKDSHRLGEVSYLEGEFGIAAKIKSTEEALSLITDGYV